MNAGAWLPCMLSLDMDEVQLFSERGLEFSCRAGDLGVEIVGFGNLRLIAGEGTFELSAVGGRAVPLPLPPLEKRMESFKATHPDCLKESRIEPITQWQALLVAAGAQSRGRTRSGLRLLWGISVSVLVAVVLGAALVVVLAGSR